ncbi:PIN domain nuclease of toxin-antitoxin system [Rhizobium sp. BK650]|uniref:hypothetical protein n=1 Tax=Rhizobium sp. BK650 TaxID=2586990 RepID=UPI00161DEFEE|nr:hypothetical protein [Rhizobium sp. BK650]MBB3656839.1 PIN domain nuclease of toxin-antitoxin system [Rhizobium sp. BK650]
MVQWFEERYISREEHQRIVDYYRKLVAQLYCTVRDLRTAGEMQKVQIPAASKEPGDIPAAAQHSVGLNVITVDFRRRSAHRR